MKKFIDGLVKFLRTPWYVLTTVPFVLWCVAWNWVGLLLSAHIGTPILFFDMTGTALASLSRGLGYGVFVALLSNLLPLALPDSVSSLMEIDVHVYAWFGLTNAIGAIVWAMSPRIFVRFQGSGGGGFLSTDPEVGYAILVHQIVLVGVVVAGATTLTGIATQALAVGCSPASQFNACTDASPAVKTSYLLLHFFGFGPSAVVGTYYFVLLSFNVPDKMVATATAMMLMFFFHHVPNYRNQQQALRQFYRKTETWPKSFRLASWLYVISCVGFMLAYYIALFGHRRMTLGTGVVFWVGFAFVAAFIFRPLGMPLHSVFYRRAVGVDIYHDPMLVGRQSVHRDVFEDILKTNVMFVTLLNLLLERLQRSASRSGNLMQPVDGGVISLKVLPATSIAAPLQTAVTLGGPIILLTLWRYFIVFLGRYTGLLYRQREATDRGAGPSGGIRPEAAESEGPH